MAGKKKTGTRRSCTGPDEKRKQLSLRTNMQNIWSPTRRCIVIGGFLALFLSGAPTTIRAKPTLAQTPYKSSAPASVSKVDVPSPAPADNVFPEQADNHPEHHAFLRNLEIRVLALKTRDYVLTESLVALEDPVFKHVWLPVRATAEAFEFSLDPPERQVYDSTVSGWFHRKERTFQFNPSTGEAYNDTGQVPSKSGDIFLLDGIIYASATLLSRVWPVELAFESNDSAIIVSVDETLPFQARLERQQRIALVHARKKREKPDAHFPKEPRKPYALWSKPFVDTTIHASWAEGRKSSSNWRHTLVGEYLYMTTQASIEYSLDHAERNGNVHYLDFVMSRKDASGGIFGFDGLRELMIGDIAPVPIPLLPGGGRERGVYFSTRPFWRPNNNLDTTSFSGIAKPGYYAELYRGGILLDARTVTENGRYDFQDVPLIGGKNALRVKVYAPEGLVREDSKTVNLRDSMAPKGETSYTFSLSESGYAVADFFLREKHENNASGRPRTALRIDHGLSEGLSGSLTLGQIPLRKQTPSYLREKPLQAVGGTLSASLLGGFAEIQAASATNGGKAFGLFYSRDIEGIPFLRNVAVSVASKKFDRKYAVLRGNQTLRTTLLNLGAAIPVGTTFLQSLTNILEYQSSLLDDAPASSPQTRQREELRYHMTAQMRNFSVLLSAQGTKSGKESSFLPLTGKILLRKDWYGTSVRSGITYRTDSEYPLRMQATDVHVQFSRRFDENLQGSLTLSRIFSSDTNSLALSIRKVFEKITTSIYFNATNGGQLQGGVFLSFSLQPDVRWKTRIQARSDASRGAIRVRYFLDRNQNKKRNAHEQTIDGIRPILRNRRAVSQSSDGQGYVLIRGLEDGVPQRIGALESSVADVDFQPAQEFIVATPRKGQIIDVDFPFFLSGAVEGQVFAKNPDGTKSPAMNVELVLTDEQGNRKRTTTDFEGYYYVDRLLAGEYTIRTREEQKYQGKQIAHEEQRFVIGPDRNNLFVVPEDMIFSVKPTALQ